MIKMLKPGSRTTHYERLLKQIEGWRSHRAQRRWKMNVYLPTKPLTIMTRCSGKLPCSTMAAASQRSSPPRTFSTSNCFPFPMGSLKQLIQRTELAFPLSLLGSWGDHSWNPSFTQAIPLRHRIRWPPGIPKPGFAVLGIEPAASIRGRRGSKAPKNSTVGATEGRERARIRELDRARNRTRVPVPTAFFYSWCKLVN